MSSYPESDPIVFSSSGRQEGETVQQQIARLMSQMNGVSPTMFLHPGTSEGSSWTYGSGKKKKKADQEKMPGDWECPHCGDHQFARNTQCRQCGKEKPKDYKDSSRSSPF
mmetsp:Transcript_58553/g.92557  ORF Transcript_58553/g.92557 Transcript_58553/m.92557 type:complete len:110 (-) Transcript_58553:14-343(-)